MYDNITGFILSGGRSSRMGENKSLMKIGNKSVIEGVADLMLSLFSKVELITNDPGEYAFLNLDMHEDIFPGMGPLAGIHSGLSNSNTEQNFFISCDIPLMVPEMIKYLVEYKTEKPVTIAKADGFVQQLCGRYNESCLPFAGNILSSNPNTEGRESEQKKRGCRVLDLIDIVGAEIINAESLPFYKKDIYFNMNKRSDFEIVLKKKFESS